MSWPLFSHRIRLLFPKRVTNVLPIISSVWGSRFGLISPHKPDPGEGALMSLQETIGKVGGSLHNLHINTKKSHVFKTKL